MAHNNRKAVKLPALLQQSVNNKVHRRNIRPQRIQSNSQCTSACVRRIVCGRVPVTQLKSHGMLDLARTDVDERRTAGLGGDAVPAVTEHVRRV